MSDARGRLCPMAKKDTHDNDSISEVLRLPQGPVDMASLDAGATPGFPGQDKDDSSTPTAPAMADPTPQT